jgi:maltodextrin utilization protein YvdJ
LATAQVTVLLDKAIEGFTDRFWEALQDFNTEDMANELEKKSARFPYIRVFMISL